MLLIIEILALVTMAILACFSIFDSEVNTEPWIVLSSVIIAFLEILRRKRLKKHPRQSGELAFSIDQKLTEYDVYYSVPFLTTPNLTWRFENGQIQNVDIIEQRKDGFKVHFGGYKSGGQKIMFIWKAEGVQ